MVPPSALLIRHARILSLIGDFLQEDVFIEGGTIQEISPSIADAQASKLEAYACCPEQKRNFRIGTNQNRLISLNLMPFNERFLGLTNGQIPLKSDRR